MAPDLSIIIVNWNTAALLCDCLASLVATSTAGRSEILVVDNASRDDSVGMVQQHFPSVQLIQNSANVGFARANNQGIVLSQGRYLLLLNSDTVVPPDTLAELLTFMEHTPDAGACSPRLVRPDGQPQAFAFGGDPTPRYLFRRGLHRLLLRRGLHNWHTTQIESVDWVSGAALLLRRAALEQTGGLDENIFMYFEDNDLCLRIRQAGWKVYYNPQVAVIHIGGQSLKQNPVARRAYYHSLEYFYAKHYGRAAQLWLKLGLGVYRRIVRM